MDVTVRDAHSEDAGTVVDFNRRLAEETEGRMLPIDVLAAGVAAVLADRAKGRYFVAEHQGRVVGQVMITHEWSDWRNGSFWWLQSVYVARDARRLGVFQRMLDHVRRQMQLDPSAVGLRLYVDDDNHAAQAVYERLGFRAGHYRVMESLGRSGDGETAWG